MTSKTANPAPSGATHPDVFPEGATEYSPPEWTWDKRDVGRSHNYRYYVYPSQESPQRYWPGLKINDYPWTIRDRNPFKTFKGAVAFVEKAIVREKARQAKAKK